MGIRIAWPRADIPADLLRIADSHYCIGVSEVDSRRFEIVSLHAFGVQLFEPLHETSKRIVNMMIDPERPPGVLQPRRKG